MERCNTVECCRPFRHPDLICEMCPSLTTARKCRLKRCKCQLPAAISPGTSYSLPSEPAWIVVDEPVLHFEPGLDRCDRDLKGLAARVDHEIANCMPGRNCQPLWNPV